MKMLNKIFANLFVFLLLVIPVFVLADDPPSPGSTDIEVKISNPFKGGDTLPSLITAILNDVIMPVAAVAVVMWIIWAGFQYLRAQGKPAEIQKANKNLMWSLIGAGILLGAAAISAVVQNTFKGLIQPS